MEDLVNHIKAQLYEKARSPLFGAFFISWISWNFSTILLVFSKGEFDKKILFIIKLYPTNWHYFLNGILYPLLSAAVFITIYPLLAKLAFWHWNSQHVKIKKIQQAQEDDTPATMEEIRTLRKVSLEREAELQNEIRNAYTSVKEYKNRESEYLANANKQIDKIAELNSSISKLNELIQSKDNELNSKSKKLNKFQNEFKSLEEKFINLVSNKNKEQVDIEETEEEEDGLPRSEIIKNNPKLMSVFNKLKNDIQLKGLIDLEIELLILVAMQDGTLNLEEWVGYYNGVSSIELDHALKDLENHHDFIYLTDDFGNGRYIKLSESGKKLVVEKKLMRQIKVANK